MLTVICNRGKKPNTQEEMSDEITLNFWGKYANFAAKYLDVGREINVHGELRSHRHQTGQINPASQKPIIERRVEILVNRCYFGKDSMKEMGSRVNAKIAALKQAGRIPVDAILTAEELLAVERPNIGDYNPAESAVTGKYGNAKVWVKGQGFIGTGGAIPTGTVAAGAAAGTNVEGLKAQMEEISKALTAAGAGGDANPFTPAT
jgi:single-stranded DNA-binding protein